MPTDNPARFAGVLARHEGRVVLVREEYPSWGGAHWNIPSGGVEAHESPAEGASRELAEETGLVLPPGDLELRCTSSVATADRVSRAWNFIGDVQDPTLSVDDPDGLIQEARWFTPDEAVRLLRVLPYRPLWEPAVAILSGEVEAGAHWDYVDPQAPPVVTHGT
jgi:8-oxo-dGTP diphosphatase